MMSGASWHRTVLAVGLSTTGRPTKARLLKASGWGDARSFHLAILSVRCRRRETAERLLGRRDVIGSKHGTCLKWPGEKGRSEEGDKTGRRTLGM